MVPNQYGSFEGFMKFGLVSYNDPCSSRASGPVMLRCLFFGWGSISLDTK